MLLLTRSVSGLLRDAAAAKRFLAKSLSGENQPAPRVINSDHYAGYPPAIAQLKAEGALEQGCQHRPVEYLNNVLPRNGEHIGPPIASGKGGRASGRPPRKCSL